MHGTKHVVDLREFKLNGMDAWIIPSKHEVENKMLKR